MALRAVSACRPVSLVFFAELSASVKQAKEPAEPIERSPHLGPTLPSNGQPKEAAPQIKQPPDGCTEGHETDTAHHR